MKLCIANLSNAIRKVVFGTVILLFLAAPKPGQAQSGRDILLMVDNDKFIQNDLSLFRKELLDQAARSGATETAEVKARESLSQLVSRLYGYGVTSSTQRFKQIQAEIMESIAKLNAVEEPNKILAGQILTVPKYFRRPQSTGSSIGAAQVLNLAKANLADTTSQTLSSRTPAYTVETTLDNQLWTRQAATADGDIRSTSIQRSAATSLLRIDPEQLTALGGLPGLRAQVNNGTFSLLPSTQQYEVSFSQPQTSGNGTTRDPPPSRSDLNTPPISAEQLQKIQQAGTGKLYFLDVFSKTGSATCSHGDLVYTKATQTLASLGLASEASRIEKISIDYYSDVPGNTLFIKNWIQRSFRGQALVNYTTALATLSGTQIQTPSRPNSIIVPGLFLQAIYGSLANNTETLVISGSFYTNLSDTVFPKDILLNDRANLVNAVLNDASAIESKTQVFQEPLSTFNFYRDLLGTVLVGYFDENGVARGMYSENGFGVTTIDDGVVVGDVGPCLGQREVGASFATPVVAVKLFIGRLLWGGNGTGRDALNARGRLLSSAAVRRDYVGKYWSAGAAEPNRLYAPAGRYLTTPNGDRSDASSYSGHLKIAVEVPLSSGNKIIEYTFDTEKEDPSPAFISMIVGDETAFLLERQRENQVMWHERKIISFCFCLDNTEKTNIPFSNINKFFKEISRND